MKEPFGSISSYVIIDWCIKDWKEQPYEYMYTIYCINEERRGFITVIEGNLGMLKTTHSLSLSLSLWPI